MIDILAHIGDALLLSFKMFWQIFWGLSLGFAFSAMTEVLVSKSEMKRLLPDAGLRSVATASALGAASSSCSYAAVAMTRSVIRKGADFIAAMAFQFAATNLVLELGVLMWVLLAWQFAAAEFIGGAIMIALLVWGLRLLVSRTLIETATEQAGKNVAGSMEGHAAMALGAREGSWRQRLSSRKGWVAISHYYVMNWSMLWKELLIGLLVAGALGAWVPDHVWRAFFFADQPLLGTLWSALIGPLIALAAFTCSIGNVPLAAVLWQGGIGFAGVIAFIFGDLIIVPILLIYRKYYGTRMAATLGGLFYAVMVLAALAVEGLFKLAGLVPHERHTDVMNTAITLNYTSVLNAGFFVVATILLITFWRTGGPAMMRHMAKHEG